MRSIIKSFAFPSSRERKITAPCTRHNPFIYNLNENIWEELYHGIHKEITFSRNPKCTICAKIRRAFAAAYGPAAGDFDEEQPFQLEPLPGPEIYFIHPVNQHVDDGGKGLYLLTLDAPDGKAAGREVRAESIDVELVKDWIRCCENWHGQACDLGDHTPLDHCQDLMVIDVVDGRLVDVPCSSRYMALSYVWGGISSLQTLKTNLKQHQQPGGLVAQSAALPKTISDAIKLTSSIGERYLWVDALCIVQDDLDGKLSLINQMDKIYQNAVCTIVAAFGTDSSAGLPGVTSPRNSAQQTLDYGKSRRIAISQRPFEMFLGREGHSGCVWNKRAWTHQERLLSGRKLVFLEDGVHFNCQKITWTEDVRGEKEEFHHHFQMYDFTGISRMERFYSGMWPPGSSPRKRDEYTLRGRRALIPNFVEYCNLVHSHMRRALTFEEDLLNSFQGILKHLSDTFSGFTYGMSDLFFSLCLLWQPADFCRRRNRTKGLETPVQLDLPSWTWAAWVGEIDLTHWKAACDYLLHDDIETAFRTTPSIQFKNLPSGPGRKHGETVAGRDTWAQYREMDFSTAWEWIDELQTPGRWQCRDVNSRYSRGRTQHCEFFIPLDPSRFFLYPIPLPGDHPSDNRPSHIPSSTLLLCTTEVARCTVFTKTFQYLNRENAAGILDDLGTVCGVIYLHDPLASVTSQEELVKISDGEVFVGCMDSSIFPEKGLFAEKDGFYRYVNVLLTKKVDGIRVRAGAGRVRLEAWKASIGMKVEEVILG